MSQPVLVPVTASPADLLHALQTGSHVVVSDRPGEMDTEVVDRLVDALDGPGAGTASPVPVSSAHHPALYALHPGLPPAPSLALPARRLCAFHSDAIASIREPVRPGATSSDVVVQIAERLTHHGWRHVAAPGVALAWNPADASGVTTAGGWTAGAISSLVGPANAGLEAHHSWASAQLDGVTVAVDGACLTDDPFTGTQHLVVEVSRWLARCRPDARIKLAVRRSQIESVRRRLDGASVDVVARSTSLDADVVYRPYQMLFARELPFAVDVGRRSLVGQLDMIGFANAAYHPSDALFFFARNLQRFLMRTADGVTFISDYGRQAALAECPDLDRERLHVVSCGADPVPMDGRLGDDRSLDAGRGFLVCLSSTFWHKNRAHAIAVFADLAMRHGYSGSLVVGGPEPYFGRSISAEDELLGTLPAGVSARVQRWGHIRDEEKWWLLTHADAVLYPSIVEGFGLVPFEASAVGTPCLAYAGTAPGELLAGTTALVDSWHPTDWADRVTAWLADSASSARTVREIAEVARHHTWQRCAERTWSAIDDALARPRRAVHADDGNQLTRIALDGRRRASAGGTRFDVARGLPAVRRRVTQVIASRSGR